mmetsp:Transcript_16445/g.28173  ORF Transcript_16445/g.28173 Transcript_16445/m.28173 type:complete len:107 (+) Transcript_16445:176-496(+)
MTRGASEIGDPGGGWVSSDIDPSHLRQQRHPPSNSTARLLRPRQQRNQHLLPSGHAHRAYPAPSAQRKRGLVAPGATSPRQQPRRAGGEDEDAALPRVGETDHRRG